MEKELKIGKNKDVINESCFERIKPNNIKYLYIKLIKFFFYINKYGYKSFFPQVISIQIDFFNNFYLINQYIFPFLIYY